MKQALTFFFLFILGFTSLAQEAKAYLKDQEIRIGEQTEIEIEVRFKANEAVIFPALQDTISQFVEIVKASDIDTTFDEEDISIKIFTQTITVTSWDSGFHAIAPLQFKIGDKTVETAPLLLSVITVPLEEQADIKDIKPIIEVPFSLSDFLLANRLEIGGILLLIGLLILAYFLYRKYANRPQEEVEAIIPKEAADSLAFRKLEDLKNKKLWQNGKTKLYYVELSYILREYIGNRYQLHALEHTTDEIMLLVERLPEIDKSWKQKLHDTLLLADMAKFAKQTPLASENETSLQLAYGFIEATAVKENEQESEELNQKTEVQA
tara:strand:- start:1191 stop:2159 length:969 start_codon:yes stop_codon:yes gene_type:complete